MTTSARQTLTAYFEADAQRDVEAGVALFTDDGGKDRYRATGRIDGNFPGATADLKWDFTIAGDRISRLEIAP
jgi:hypothetical protein